MEDRDIKRQSLEEAIKLTDTWLSGGTTLPKPGFAAEFLETIYAKLVELHKDALS